MRTLAITLLLASLAGAAQPEQGPERDLATFFQSVDTDGDGQIEDYEVRKYVRDNLGVEAEAEVEDAVNLVHRNLETPDDADRTVSESELETHLRGMLQGHRVVDWVVHGLELPRYADAFREYAITAYELPHLLQDGGVTLAEMGVDVALHRQKIMRHIKKLLLGLGDTPDPPQRLHCLPVSCSAVKVEWDPPERPGSPPLHKYILERTALFELERGPGTGVWVAVANLTSDESSFIDAAVARGAYQYKIKAWNTYDRSESVVSAPCQTTDGGLPCAGVDAGSSWRLLGLLSTAAVILLSLRSLVAQLLGKLSRQLGAHRMADSLECFASPLDDPLARSHSLTRTLQRGATFAYSFAAQRLGSNLHVPANGLSYHVAAEQLHSPSKGASGSVHGAPGWGRSPFDERPYERSNSGVSTREFEHCGSGAEGRSYRRMDSTISSGHGSDYSAGMSCDAPNGSATVGSDERRKNRCAHAGCDNKVSTAFLKLKLRSHYCGTCQRYYCIEHTRITTHGDFGDCGVESKCVCMECFHEFDPTRQAAYLQLHKNSSAFKKSRSGGKLHGSSKNRTSSDSAEAAAVAGAALAAGR